MKLIAFAYSPIRGGHETYADWLVRLPELGAATATLETEDGWLVKVFLSHKNWPTVKLAGECALIGESPRVVGIVSLRSAIGYRWASKLSVEEVGFALLPDATVAALRDFAETVLQRAQWVRNN